MVAIKVPKKTVEKIKQFAEDVEKTNDYSDTEQTDSVKKKLDNVVAKIGEEGVYIYLTEAGRKVTPVDYRIFSKENKSWDSDLKISSKTNENHLTNLAVKSQSQSSAKRFGLSWMFQDSPEKEGVKARRDKILSEPESYVYFTEVSDISDEDGSATCFIHYLLQIKDCIKIFKEPKLNKLKGLKKVVYATDILIK